MAGIGVANVVPDLSGLAALASIAKQRAVALKAIKAGAKLVQQAVKVRAPRRPGRGGGGLRQSIGIKSVKGRKGRTLAYAVVGSRLKVERQVPHGKKTRKHVPGFVAHIVEGGAKPHSTGKGARLARRGKAAVGQAGRMHPGARAKPFIGPAWAATRLDAIGATRATLAAELLKAIQKEAARLAGKLKG